MRLKNKFLNSELNEQYKKIVIPILIQGFFMGFLDIINTIIVSGVGQRALVVIGIVAQINFVFWLFSYGAGNAISIFVTQYIGKKDWKGLNKTLALSKIIYLIVVVIFLVFSTMYSQYVMQLFTKDQSIIHSAKHILLLAAIGTVPRLSYSFIIDSFRALDYTKILLYITIFTELLNISLSFVLCYGVGIFPRLGVDGSMIGYDISFIIQFALYIALILRKDNPMQLGISSAKYLDKSYIFRVLKKMLPLLLMEVTWSIGIAGYTIILSKGGPQYIAAASLTGSIITFFMTFYSSMNAATSTIIGRTLGANELEKAKYFTKRLMMYAIYVGLGANIILILFAEPIINIFNFSGKIEHETLKISYYVLIGRSARIGIGSIAVTIINGVLKAGGDTKFIPVIELSSIFIFGLGFSILAYNQNLGAFWIAFGMSIEQFARLIFGYIRYKQMKWVNNLTH